MSPSAIVLAAAPGPRQRLVAALARPGWRVFSAIDADSAEEVMRTEPGIAAVVVRAEPAHLSDAIAALVRARRYVPDAVRALVTPSRMPLTTDLAHLVFPTRAHARRIAQHVGERHAQTERVSEPAAGRGNDNEPEPLPVALEERIARAVAIVPAPLRGDVGDAVVRSLREDPVLAGLVDDVRRLDVRRIDDVR